MKAHKCFLWTPNTSSSDFSTKLAVTLIAETGCLQQSSCLQFDALPNAKMKGHESQHYQAAQAVCILRLYEMMGYEMKLISRMQPLDFILFCDTAGILDANSKQRKSW